MWCVNETSGESILQPAGYSNVNHVQDTQAVLVDCPESNYSIKTEMWFVRNYLPDGGAGWFGFVIQARDSRNFEDVWFIPRAKRDSTVAYLSAAHGVVPWWTGAYATQEKGNVPIDGRF